MLAMIRPLVLSVALLTASAANAQAPADPRVEPAFGNTITATYPDGRTARLWLDRDGSYRSISRRGNASSGEWRVRGGDVCLRQRAPRSIPFRYCTAIVPGGVGTRWTGRAPTGETIQNRLVARR